MWTWSIRACVRESTCSACLWGSRTHRVGLICETFSWDMPRLGLRSQAVIVYWFRLGCSVQFGELLLQSTDCNDGEPSMWQHWLHQRVCVYLSSQVFIRSVRVLNSCCFYTSLSLFMQGQTPITEAQADTLTVRFHPFIHSFTDLGGQLEIRNSAHSQFHLY